MNLDTGSICRTHDVCRVSPTMLLMVSLLCSENARKRRGSSNGSTAAGLGPDGAAAGSADGPGRAADVVDATGRDAAAAVAGPAQSQDQATTTMQTLMQELYANMNAVQRGRFDGMQPIQKQQILLQYQMKRTQFINANLARSRQVQQVKHRIEFLQGQATRSPAEEQELQSLVQRYQLAQAQLRAQAQPPQAQPPQAQQQQQQQQREQQQLRLQRQRQQRQQQQQQRQQLSDTAAPMLATIMEQQDAALLQQPADLADVVASRKQADAAAAMRRDDAVQNALPQYDRDVADAHAAAAQRREEARTKLEELNSKVVAIRAQLDEADPDPVAGSAAGPPATSKEVECPICLDHPKRIVFQCGHQACAACAASIQVCHSCRAPITHRITPF